MKNVAVFFGGESVEHDVSVITGVLTLNTLKSDKYNPIPIYVHTDGKWYTGQSLLDLDEYKSLDTKRLTRVVFLGGESLLYAVKKNKLKPFIQIHVAINCMHGQRGEDGSLSGLLNMCSVANASPNILSSAVSMDKAFTKTVMRALKIKTLPYVVVSGIDECKKVKEKLKFPVMVKPLSLGSSIGVSKANDSDQLVNAINFALRYDQKVIVEQCLEDFIEINCSAYTGDNGGVIISECEQPVGATKTLSFADKYRSGKRVFPAQIDKSISDKIKDETEKVYRELGFFGVIRIDYFVSDGVVYLNEINSVPGSLAYYLFCDSTKEFFGMLDNILTLAQQRFYKTSTVQKVFDSGLLFTCGCKGAKKKS